MASSSSSTAAEKVKIKIESETSEFYVEMKETDKVKDLLKIVQKTWGDGDEYMTLYHQTILMENEKPLSAYNIKDGCVVHVKVDVD